MRWWIVVVAMAVAGCSGPDGGSHDPPGPSPVAGPRDVSAQEDCAQRGLMVRVKEPGGRGLADAHVLVFDTVWYGSTDRDGWVAFPEIEPGAYTIRITAAQEWYRTTETEVEVATCRKDVTVTLDLQQGLLTPPHVHDDAWAKGPIIEVFTQVFDMDCVPRQNLCQGDDQPSTSMMPFLGVVPPGTGALNFTVTWAEPAAFPFEMIVRSPANRDHRDMVFEQPGDIVSIPVEPSEPDPAHAVGSSWGWFWGASDGVWPGPFTVKVDAVRGDYDLPIDPPHPDLWRGRTSYRLLEGNASWDGTRTYVMEGGYNTPIYGMFQPEPGLTVIPGATQMYARAWINHTLSHDPDVELWYWAADDVDPIYGGGRSMTASTADGVLYEWTISVHETWYDTLYGNESEWDFSVRPVALDETTGLAWDGGAAVHLMVDVARNL